jgi:multidrug efflux system membrane fusion protein
LPVGVATAMSGDLDVSLNALGTVTPLATVTVKPQVSGPLIKIAFTEGETVRQGQVLAEIDPRPFQAALDQTKGQLARDEAQLANAEVDLNRYQMLIAQNSIAQQQVDSQAALVRQDQAIVKTDQANVETAQINLGYTTIASPINGRVGLRQVDVGNLVTAGQATGIVVVTQLEPISVVFTVPEDDISDVMAQVNGKATLTVDAYDRAQTKKLASGTLSTVDNQIDTATGSVKMRAIFDNAKGDLFPNQFVNIKLFVKTLHDQIVLPSSAVQRGASGTFVYVVNEDHTVSIRPIMIGLTEGDRVSIAQGVMVGDMVVIDGADRLRDGATVVLPGEQPPPAAAPQARGQQNGQGGRRGGGGRGGRRGGGGQGTPAGANPGPGAAPTPGANAGANAGNGSGGG